MSTTRTSDVASGLVDRANRIHASYHALDLSLVRALGTHRCSNFFTYAKHAAREAGVQAADADSAIIVLASLPSRSDGLTGGAMSAAMHLRALLRRPDMVAKASALAKAKRSKRGVVNALHTLRRGLDVGNESISERLTPAFRDFLSAPDERPRVENALLAAGLAHYARARAFSRELERPALSSDERATLQTSRRDAIRAGNNLIVFYEQLYLAQSFYDEMREEMVALDGLLSLHHPGGVHRLARGWADFYTRMGIDAAVAPEDPRRLGPGDVPRIFRNSTQGGTIADYFNDNFDNARLRLPPLPIARR